MNKRWAEGHDASMNAWRNDSSTNVGGLSSVHKRLIRDMISEGYFDDYYLLSG
jgi:hypothetical protein